MVAMITQDSVSFTIMILVKYLLEVHFSLENGRCSFLPPMLAQFYFGLHNITWTFQQHHYFYTQTQGTSMKNTLPGPFGEVVHKK